MSMVVTDCVLLLLLLALSSSTISASEGGRWREATSRHGVCHEHWQSTRLPVRQMPALPRPGNEPPAGPASNSMTLHST